MVEISGRVTRGGKPVKDLSINFIPEKGRPSWGLTDAEGRYTLHYTREQDGAVVGKHKVYVTYDPPTDDPGVYYGRMEGRFEGPDDIKAILDKYGDAKTTPLEVDIENFTRNWIFDVIVRVKNDPGFTVAGMARVGKTAWPVRT